MTKQYPKAYIPKDHENSIYEKWEASGAFQPEVNQANTAGKSFTIAMPPPNVTGNLHIGHVLGTAIQDTLIRWKRMQGYQALYLPGTDHAGIATQAVVEKKIQSEENKSRHDLGRDEFIKRVWEYKKETHDNITNQIRKIGASCDWTRERFTLDEGLSRAVNTAFKKLYDDGLIYRGYRIVNWCPRCSTGLSDLEVEHKQAEGLLYYLRYSIKGSKEQIVVATTRPETMLGDMAVAVHPDDERYTKLIGQTAILPLVEREIPIIADSGVDPGFGTGAVKVTPAHDPLDYDISERHDLEKLNVIDEDGKITEDGGEYAGLPVKEAREKIVADLEKQNLIEKTEGHKNAISTCSRCETDLQPLISRQWFVRIEKLAKRALAVVEDQDIKIIPDRFKKTYQQWMENIHDWNISRQLWWGHRIPVYYCEDCYDAATEDTKGLIISVENPTTCPTCQGNKIHQEEDTLDTWFSSGLWTFSTLGWPEQTEDLKKFHPTQVMETGYDILFFWVARMIMMTLYLTDQIPFEHIYLHGLVLDEHGKKMSKSKGNVIDPLDLIDKFGTDAVRLALTLDTQPGQNIRLSEQKIAKYRNFANKLWNIARYILTQTDEPDDKLNKRNLTTSDRWILARMTEMQKQFTAHLTNYRFSLAGQILYSFVWSEFADWYLEMTKIEKGPEQPKVLRLILENILKLSHPFMPFVTEAIWQQWEKPDLLIKAAWPTEQVYSGSKFKTAENNIQKIISEISSLRDLSTLQDGKKVKVTLTGDKNIIEVAESLLEGLAPVEVIATRTKATNLKVKAEISADAKKKIKKEATELAGYIKKLEKKLLDKKFVNNAPLEIATQEQERLRDLREKHANLKQRLK
ncbi:valine--tRNA ligase [Patescibacteria group bacterium]